MKKSENIEAKIEKLPDHVKSELNDYIDFLLSKHGEKGSENHSGFKFDWEGKLSDLTNYSSVELQHKAMEWR